MPTPTGHAHVPDARQLINFQTDERLSPSSAVFELEKHHVYTVIDVDRYGASKDGERSGVLGD